MTHGTWLTQCESLWVTHAVWFTVWLTMCASHWITYGVIHGVTHGVWLTVCDSRCVTHAVWLTVGNSRCVTYGVTHDVCFTLDNSRCDPRCDSWCVTHDVWLTVCDSRCVTHGAWLTRCDSQWVTHTVGNSRCVTYRGDLFKWIYLHLASLFLMRPIPFVSIFIALRIFNFFLVVIFCVLRSLILFFTVTSFSNDSPFYDRACSPLPVRLSFPWSPRIALGSLDSASSTVGKSFLCSTPSWSYIVVWFVSFSL